jgi:hypothetical protein
MSPARPKSSRKPTVTSGFAAARSGSSNFNTMSFSSVNQSLIKACGGSRWSVYGIIQADLPVRMPAEPLPRIRT